MSIDVHINPSYRWGADAKGKGISHRELEVIALVAQGYSNEEISEILQIKYQSVKNHMYNLTKKLGANNVSHALLLAIGKNLIKVENPEMTPKPVGKPTGKEIFIQVLKRLGDMEETELSKKVKIWLIRQGVDVDI